MAESEFDHFEKYSTKTESGDQFMRACGLHRSDLAIILVVGTLRSCIGQS